MYRVELQQFEGPMDLLLFFIKRDEVDIYDIPVAQIADEYLRYVRLLEEVDLDGVGDFIYMAAILINLKAQMLLPSDEEDGEGDAVDPRRELVERLLEYVRFKEAADQLSARREQRVHHFPRGDASDQKESVQEAHEADVEESVIDLVQVLGDLLQAEETEETEPTHEVEPLQHTVDDQQEYVLDTLSTASRVSFRDLVRDESKGFIIATFLAVLEMARQHHLRIELRADATDFVLSAREDTPEDPDAATFGALGAPTGDGVSEPGPARPDGSTDG